MPWFPDFVAAAELVRRENRAAGQADPVTLYFAALERGDLRALETVWPGQVVVHDPRVGEVRGHGHLRRFLHDSRARLAQRHAHTEPVASMSSNGRAVLELLAHLTMDGHGVLWPVSVIAESHEERSVVFRSYFSRWPLDGLQHVRPPILEASHVQPGDVVARYEAALDAGDTDAIVNTFAPDGYYREPLGPEYAHRGTAELRAFFSKCFSAGGGIGLENCAVTDDGVSCAVEYNCIRWGSYELPPQAGMAVFERGPDGLLVAARVYDEVEAPVQLDRIADDVHS
jgi:limonene-1,2-epoxide hydrolase